MKLYAIAMAIVALSLSAYAGHKIQQATNAAYGIMNQHHSAGGIFHTAPAATYVIPASWHKRGH